MLAEILSQIDPFYIRIFLCRPGDMDLQAAGWNAGGANPLSETDSEGKGKSGAVRPPVKKEQEGLIHADESSGFPGL